MRTDALESRGCVGPSRWLKTVVLLLVAVNVVVLGVNAATTTIWEDEANGFFLARKPLPELLEAMSGNVHEDPPLYDVVLHAWINVVGYHVPALRGLSIVFWCLMLPGLFLATRRLAGANTAWLAVGIACLLPNHWLFPASMRWYSLFSCLSMWNLYFFLEMLERSRQGVPLARPVVANILLVAPYALTGAALWYTNYSAPILFFSHLVVALIGPPERRRIVTGLVAGWCVISLLYLPWVPTFLRQMGDSVHTFSVTKAALTIWVLVAGEFSTPLNLWMACCVTVTGLLLTMVVFGRIRECWIPPLIILIALSAMGVSGVIWTKRVLYLVPLLAMTFALALGRRENSARWLATAQGALLVMGLAVTVSSFVQMVRRDHWATYRWLDPIEVALDRVEQRTPEAVVLTNSNPALFYLHDELGKAAYTSPPRNDGFRFTGLFYPFADHLVPRYQSRLAGAQKAVYLHHWAYGGPLSKSYEEVVQQMEQFGFRPDGTESLLRMSPGFIKRHLRFKDSGDNRTDPYRVVLLYFSKPSGGDGSAVPVRVAQEASDGKTKVR